MKVQQFLSHHQIKENPFGQEDAQSDHVFRQHCLAGTHHPAWDKIYGNPQSPSTSVVFGEKGSGKTALQLQIIEQLLKNNQENPDSRTFIIRYDDFNPFLDSFRERLYGRSRKPERALVQWRLWDHMDAILTLGATRLVNLVIADEFARDPLGEKIEKKDFTSLNRLHKRDLLLLSALYDHTFDQARKTRWTKLRKKLRFSTWRAEWDRVLGVLITALVLFLVLYFGEFADLGHWWIWGIIVAGWLPWLWRQIRLVTKVWKITRQIRIFEHLPNTLRQILARFERQELAGQPLPSRDRSDDRYELLIKFQSLLREFGYEHLIVLVDRVDEPHLINGSPERMRDLLWPMFDNKFLKQPGIGFKLLLPAEVAYYVHRAEKEFYERSRLDKQNLIPSLDWTGESLYDVAQDRLRACTEPSADSPYLRSLFDEAITETELLGVFARFRVPRHLFKFLHSLIVEHCNRYTEASPSWRINRETLQSTLALSLRDLQEFDQGRGTG